MFTNTHVLLYNASVFFLHMWLEALELNEGVTDLLVDEGANGVNLCAPTLNIGHHLLQ